jgi:mannosyltransferase
VAVRVYRVSERVPGLGTELRQVARSADTVWRRIGLAVLALGAAACIFLRFWCPSALWLDETLSVNISKLPLTQIPGALSHDGSPPLYYVVLHLWMLVFGQSDVAVRALSGVVSVVSLPLFWSVGYRFGGRRTAWVLLTLGLTSPFAIEYATTTRMYSFMILWALLGVGVLWRALEEPTRERLIALGALTAALLYTHYYGLYLVATVALLLLWRIVRESRRGPSPDDPPGIRPAFGAMVVGGVCWLPWTPVFVYQTLHTGTPWTASASPADLLGVFGDFAGTGAWGLLLSFGFFGLIVLGIFGRRVDDPEAAEGAHAVLLATRPRRSILPLVLVLLGTLVLAVILDAVASAAFVSRYASEVLPLFLTLVAVGTTMFTNKRIVAGITAVLCVAGLITAWNAAGDQRTQATQVANVLNVEAQPGDIVVSCPDQLGPAVQRLVKVPHLTQLTFPRAIGPSRVNWVDYKQTIDRTDVGAFAQQIVARLDSGSTLWLVYRDGYPGFSQDCSNLENWFNMLRPVGETVLHQDGGKYYEYENLVRFSS